MIVSIRLAYHSSGSPPGSKALDPDLLRTFVAIVRAGGVRRAADTLHLSQPAVSARRRELEAQLGVPLFERLGRRLVLTAAGRRLLEAAPAWLASGDALARDVQAAGHSARCALRLATIDAASIYVLPSVYLEYRRAHPAIQLNVQVVDSRAVLQAVRNLDADVGVLALPAAHPDIATTAFFTEELICVARPGHPLARRGAVPLSAVAAEPLVLYARGSMTRRTLDAVFDAHGITPNVVMETASPEAMKRLAEVGVGLALVPERLVGDEVERGRLSLVRLRDATFTRRLATARHRQRELPTAAQRFLETLYRRYPPVAASPEPAGTEAPATRRRPRDPRLPAISPPAPKATRPTVAGGPRRPRARRRTARSSSPN